MTNVNEITNELIETFKNNMIAHNAMCNIITGEKVAWFLIEAVVQTLYNTNEVFEAINNSSISCKRSMDASSLRTVLIKNSNLDCSDNSRFIIEQALRYALTDVLDIG